ncbi:hypothetical protein [Mammaliicoccus sciuri]|uniref:hypothetical protein n=1 Tax=Mammaliicoccus sciuri TaxID=1296 RepID=UPI002B263008|nr:hypothetical protein [Mammaliicoccus sciuri]WQK64273.1 hypothetical protein P3U20_04835 [Mammaliicoccus sciuri]
MVKNYLTIKELSLITGASISKATSIVRKLNEEMEAEGFVAIRGKLPIELVREKFPYINLSDEALKELEDMK